MYFHHTTPTSGGGDIYEATWVPVPFLGDFDGSGVVDQGDLDLVLLNWGVRADPRGLPDAWSGAPARGTIVDQEELDAVLVEWGQTAASGGAAIPEPGTAMLLLISLTAIAGMIARRAAATRSVTNAYLAPAPAFSYNRRKLASRRRLTED